MLTTRVSLISPKTVPWYSMRMTPPYTSQSLVKQTYLTSRKPLMLSITVFVLIISQRMPARPKPWSFLPRRTLILTCSSWWTTNPSKELAVLNSLIFGSAATFLGMIRLITYVRKHTRPLAICTGPFTVLLLKPAVPSTWPLILEYGCATYHLTLNSPNELKPPSVLPAVSSCILFSSLKSWSPTSI